MAAKMSVLGQLLSSSHIRGTVSLLKKDFHSFVLLVIMFLTRSLYSKRLIFCLGLGAKHRRIDLTDHEV